MILDSDGAQVLEENGIVVLVLFGAADLQVLTRRNRLDSLVNLIHVDIKVLSEKSIF